MTAHSPLLSAVWDHAAHSPDKAALVCADARVSYAQLRDAVLACAGALQGRGARRGGRLALEARPTVDFVVAYLAGHLCGCANVILDPQARAARRDYILALTRPSVAVDGALPASSGRPFRPEAGLAPGDAADVLFTTGTTGAPKGVPLSHANLAAATRNICAFLRHAPEDVDALGTPLCHAFGLGRLRSMLYVGGTCVLLPGFANVRATFKAFDDFGVTGLGMPPSVWAYFRRISGDYIGRYADRLRYVEIGTAPMPLGDRRALCRLLPRTRICHQYGLTESNRLAFVECHAALDRADVLGRETSPDIRIAVLDDAGRELPDGAEGELCVRGPVVTAGYLRPEENEGAFHGAYFRTGDCGYRDAGGDLHLVGRRKEVINVGGRKVGPVEVEDAIIALGAADCVVVAAPDPSGILGEVPKACVVKGGATPSFAEMRRALLGRLEPYKVPVAWEWIDAVPRTFNGKKQRLLLKAGKGGGKA